MDQAISRVKGSLQRVLDKNLQDLVRGIRNHKDSEGKYIQQCMDEIKIECRVGTIAVKANAVNKLIYLQMLGYDISFAAFHIIEVMASQKFTFKRIGYLAAAQSFHCELDVLTLTTNMIRKDLNSGNMHDSGVALTGLSCFINADLAQDLASDVMVLMSSTKPYVRKKAVLLMYKIFLNYPDALRPAFPRLKEKLEDSAPEVQSAAVNVICELARKNPQNYLSLAPVFFKLMTTSTNNWVLIKIIKLFGALTPLEPRLGKKLIEPLTNLIHNTSAMSLLYECINTTLAVLISITADDPQVQNAAAIQLCVQKLRILIEDSDQNLKYLGLLAMTKILKTHPKAVQAHKDIVMDCLDDKDESIRLRALDLLYGMVSKKNLMEIVKKLMTHIDKSEGEKMYAGSGSHYRDELLAKIIDICRQNNYQYVSSFEWYISVLIELSQIEATKHGALISGQMFDVAVRVKAVRGHAVKQMSALILSDDTAQLLATIQQTGYESKSAQCHALQAAAFICGEFSSTKVLDPETLEALIFALLRPAVVNLPESAAAAFVHNSGKLLARLVKDSPQTFVQLAERVVPMLEPLRQAVHVEVQERAGLLREILIVAIESIKAGESDLTVVSDFSDLFFGAELNPVAPTAQTRVQIPEGLDLDEWFYPPPAPLYVPSSAATGTPDSNRKAPQDSAFASLQKDVDKYDKKRAKKKSKESSKNELDKAKEARLAEQSNNPYFLKKKITTTKEESEKRSSKRPVSNSAEDDLAEAVAKTETAAAMPPASKSLYHIVKPDSFYGKPTGRADNGDDESSKKKAKKAKKHKKSKRADPVVDDDVDDDAADVGIVSTTFDEPEGVGSPAPAPTPVTKPSAWKDPHRALADIKLDEPLAPHERIPTTRAYPLLGEAKKVPSPQTPIEEPRSEVKKKKKDKKKKKEKDGEVETVVAPAPVDEWDFLMVDKQQPVVTPQPVVSEVPEKEVSKKKKAKKEKKSKKKKEDDDGDDVSATIISGPPPPLIVSPERLLAKNESLRVDVHCSALNPVQTTISLIMSIDPDLLAKIPEVSLKKFELQLVPNESVTLVEDTMAFPHTLTPSRPKAGVQFTASVNKPAEHQALSRSISLKGTLTYFVQKSDDECASENLDVKIGIHPSAFLTPANPAQEATVFECFSIQDNPDIFTDSRGVPFSKEFCFPCSVDADWARFVAYLGATLHLFSENVVSKSSHKAFFSGKTYSRHAVMIRLTFTDQEPAVDSLNFEVRTSLPDCGKDFVDSVLNELTIILGGGLQ